MPPSVTDEAALFAAALQAMAPDKAAAALPILQSGLARFPSSPRLWHAHGLLLRELDRRRDALRSLERAQALSPQQPKIAWALAQTRFEAGLPAVEAYARALQFNPNNPDIILGLSDALLAEGRSGEAIAGLGQLLARSPGWVEGHELLSRIRWMEGERAGFADNFEQALVVEPGNYNLRRAQLITLLHAGDFEALLAAIADGRRALGDDPLILANEAIARAEMGELALAERLFAPFVEIEDIPIQVRRMRMLLRDDRPVEAAAIYDRWLDHPDALHLVPYVASAWRMTQDPRWQWLEGQGAFIGVYDLANRLPPLDALAEHLRSLHRSRGQQLEQSVRGGTQTEGNLLMHVHPLIEQTTVIIKEAVAAHVAALPPIDARHPLLSASRGSPVRFAGSWSVRLTEMGHHSNHVHPMGWLSSALYIALPPGIGGTDRAGWLTLGAPQAELGLKLAPFRTVEPKPGRLVLFPSTMWHGTVPFGAKGNAAERLTVAFDVERPR